MELVIALGLALALASFTLSASAGLGGSLILVPAMSFVLGPKEGVVVAALMLGANNVGKVFAYRQSIPFRTSLGVLALTVLGSSIGAAALVAASERVVGVAIVVSFVLALVLEKRRLTAVSRAYAPVLAFGAGAVSGFSGTSGPMKGAALRTLALDKAHFVGAASLISMANDVAKSAVYVEASLVGSRGLSLFLMSIPLMVIGTGLGRQINRGIGESAFAGLFWAVMAGYVARILAL